MLTLFKAIESVKMGLKRVKKKIGGEKIGPRLGKKIDRLEVYTSPPGGGVTRYPTNHTLCFNNSISSKSRTWPQAAHLHNHLATSLKSRRSIFINDKN